MSSLKGQPMPVLFSQSTSEDCVRTIVDSSTSAQFSLSAPAFYIFTVNNLIFFPFIVQIKPWSLTSIKLPTFSLNSTAFRQIQFFESFFYQIIAIWQNHDEAKHLQDIFYRNSCKETWWSRKVPNNLELSKSMKRNEFFKAWRNHEK